MQCFMLLINTPWQSVNSESRAVVLCSLLYPGHLDQVWHVTFAQQQILVEWVKSPHLYSVTGLFCFLLFISSLFSWPFFLSWSSLCNFFTKFCLISLLFLNSLSNQAIVLMHVTLMLRSLESGALAQAFSKIPDGHFHALSVRLIRKFYQRLSQDVRKGMPSLLRTLYCPNWAHGAVILEACS